MAANKLINFRCPDDLLAALEAYGREHYPAPINKRGTVDYDQSKAIRDILNSGLGTLTNGEVKLERESVKPKSDTQYHLAELMDRITKLELQQHAPQQTPTLDPNIEARLDAMEAVIMGK